MIVDAFNTGDGFARCNLTSTFPIADEVMSLVHVRGKHHGEMVKACSSMSVTSFFRSQPTQNVIEAEAIMVNLCGQAQSCFSD